MFNQYDKVRFVLLLMYLRFAILVLAQVSMVTLSLDLQLRRLYF
jgi:hypothetical protein